MSCIQCLVGKRFWNSFSCLTDSHLRWMSSGVTWNLSLAFDKSLTAAFCSGREIDADVVVNIKVSQSWTLGGHLYFFAYKPVSFLPSFKSCRDKQIGLRKRFLVWRKRDARNCLTCCVVDWCTKWQWGNFHFKSKMSIYPSSLIIR